MESLLIKTDLPVDSGVRVKSVAGMGDPKRMQAQPHAEVLGATTRPAGLEGVSGKGPEECSHGWGEGLLPGFPCAMRSRQQCHPWLLKIPVVVGGGSRREVGVINRERRMTDVEIKSLLLRGDPEGLHCPGPDRALKP